MPSAELERLVAIGELHRLAVSRSEIEHLLRMGRAKLRDSTNASLAPESRFDLAYNGAHALALAALRTKGYRSEKRIVVFHALAHTVDLALPQQRILASAHRIRNQMEYEGEGTVDAAFLDALLAAAKALDAAVRRSRR